MRFIELDVPAIERIYEKYMVNDFPKCELKPLSIILNAKSNSYYKCFGLIDDITNEVCAYAYLANGKKQETVLLDYFAVNSSMRGQGIGSRMLAEIKKYYKENTKVKNIIVESESVESAVNEEQIFVRERRIRFYERNGLVRCVKRPVVFGTEYTMFDMLVEADNAKDVVIEEAKLIEEYLSVYKAMLTKKMFEENIFV